MRDLDLFPDAPHQLSDDEIREGYGSLIEQRLREMREDPVMVIQLAEGARDLIDRIERRQGRQ